MVSGHVTLVLDPIEAARLEHLCQAICKLQVPSAAERNLMRSIGRVISSNPGSFGRNESGPRERIPHD